MKRSDVVRIAKEQVGYLGKANRGDNLYIKESPNGIGPFTRYPVDLEPESWYNTPKIGAAWCCTFVDWVLRQAARDKQEVYESKPIAPSGCGASAYWQWWAFNQDNMISVKPEIGAQVFYSENGSIVHTGIVVDFDDTAIYTVEGNWANQVAERTVHRNASNIAGYGIIKYEEEEPVEPVLPEWETLFENDNMRIQRRIL